MSAATLCSPVSGRAEQSTASPWSVSLSAGWLDVEGDEPVDDAGLAEVRIAHTCGERWAVEGTFALAPDMDEQFRHEWSTGERVSRLQEAAGPGVDDTWSARATLEALLFLKPHGRFDPFLAIGGGAMWYADGFSDDLQPVILGGAGCLYNLTDAWALRADVRGLFIGADTEANATFTLGLCWTPGESRAAPALAPVSAPVAAPVVAPVAAVAGKPAEVAKPAPTVPVDSDWDALSDEDEVNRYGTDPLKRDTDGGGVYDGHEVIEDATDPKARGDDLQVFELRIPFDEGDATIKSEYFSEIGVIGKLLKDHPDGTARIEGHVDPLAVPDAKAAKRLTERRAEAVRDALVNDWKIQSSRLTPVGYGATRPKGPSAPPKGNAENERLEIYLRGTVEK
ncbi:MAG: OmpA family protein [Lentisphaerae bacterium]|nr:OmpA family protein [Lentisphaerota bacterium]